MKTHIKLQLHILMWVIMVLFAGKANLPANAQDVSSKEIIDLVNQVRRENSLAVLKENERLDQAARMKAEDMAENNYFAHTSPQGISPWHWFESAGYDYKYAGENLAMDFTTVKSAHEAWMKSQTHRDNILSSKYNEIGVAIVSGKIDGHETLVAVQLFGSKFGDDIMVEELVETTMKIEQVITKRWHESGGDEILVYAKVTGNPKDVFITQGEIKIPMLKNREQMYMVVLAAEEVVIDQALKVVAIDEKGEKVFYKIPENQYLTAIKEEKIVNENQGTRVAAAALKDQNSEWQTIINQNMMFVSALLLFVITMGNAWVLGAEDKRLLKKMVAV